MEHSVISGQDEKNRLSVHALLLGSLRVETYAKLGPMARHFRRHSVGEMLRIKGSIYMKSRSRYYVTGEIWSL